MRLCWPKSSADGNEQSDTECPSPAHLVVSKERNICVIDNEVQQHAEYEQKRKTVDLSRHPWQSFAEDEGSSDCDCAPSDNSNKDG